MKPTTPSPFPFESADFQKDFQNPLPGDKRASFNVR